MSHLNFEHGPAGNVRPAIEKERAKGGRSKQEWLLCFAYVLALLLANGCTIAARATPVVFPGTSCAVAREPELGSACRRELDATRSYLHTLDTTALMAVQDGRVLLSEGPVQDVSIVFSVRKSVLSMMYGKYVADGTIDLDRTLADLSIDDVGGLLPIERQAKLRDLLAARSGVYHAAANGGDDAAAAPHEDHTHPGPISSITIGTSTPQGPPSNV